ncbi:unnamed protein product [Phytomonas sp. Hart1]|nr:unnamed protein product [Phytomonas sp. Hart1]|eukprot:CCW67836.1 unnamed protein product [Phytomonas sp. isolate Hart1]
MPHVGVFIVAGLQFLASLIYLFNLYGEKTNRKERIEDARIMHKELLLGLKKGKALSRTERKEGSLDVDQGKALQLEASPELLLPQPISSCCGLIEINKGVVIFVMSDKIDNTLYYSVSSAYLSGLPVVVTCHRMPYKGFLSKFEFTERTIDNTGLQPHNVVIVLKLNTIFTDENIYLFIDRFVGESATTSEDLDALSVQQSRAMALFLTDRDAAVRHFILTYGKVWLYTGNHAEHDLGLSFDLSAHRRLNADTTIARV